MAVMASTMGTARERIYGKCRTAGNAAESGTGQGDVYCYEKYLSGNECSTPVSYTHLDVYKRQASVCIDTDHICISDDTDNSEKALELGGARYAEN